MIGGWIGLRHDLWQAEATGTSRPPPLKPDEPSFLETYRRRASYDAHRSFSPSRVMLPYSHRSSAALRTADVADLKP